MVDLSTKLSNITLKNPTILASGILDTKKGLLMRVVREGIGALTTKSFTVKPREGYKTPVIAYVKAGILNAIGLTNPGYREIPNIIGELIGKVPVIVSIAGSTPKEFSIIAAYAENSGANAIELNLSCPHVKGYGLEIGEDPEYTIDIVDAVSTVVSIPVFMKVGYHPKLLETVSRALDKGISGVTAINTLKAMAIDIYAKKPILSNKYGGLSGPAIHPVAVKIVYDIYREFKVPIIGIGGILSWEDAVEFILAGASAIGIGSGIAIYGLDIIKNILEGIEKYMENEGFKSISQMIGYANIG